MVPLQVALVPMLKLFGPDGLGINGQFLSVWLLHTGFGMPLAIYVLRNYMATLPKAVVESAQIDGATHFQTFWKLIVPMSVPALASFAIFQFLWVWNDLLIALLFVKGPETQPVTVTLQNMLGSLGQAWYLLTAGAFITMTAPLIVFFALQRLLRPWPHGRSRQGLISSALNGRTGQEAPGRPRLARLRGLRWLSPCGSGPPADGCSRVASARERPSDPTPGVRAGSVFEGGLQLGAEALLVDHDLEHVLVEPRAAHRVEALVAVLLAPAVLDPPAASAGRRRRRRRSAASRASSPTRGSGRAPACPW